LHFFSLSFGDDQAKSDLRQKDSKQKTKKRQALDDQTKSDLRQKDSKRKAEKMQSLDDQAKSDFQEKDSGHLTWFDHQELFSPWIVFLHQLFSMQSFFNLTDWLYK
jgi:hypothetical protein